MSDKVLNRSPFKNCLNCGEDISKEGHYVPPGMGDTGFYFCEPKDEEAASMYPQRPQRRPY